MERETALRQRLLKIKTRFRRGLRDFFVTEGECLWGRGKSGLWHWFVRSV